MPLLGTPAIQVWQEMDVIRCFINFDQRQVSPLWFMVVRVNELYCSFFLGRSHIEINQKGQGTLCDAYSNENASH